jgi:glycosyltransferase involved in cell wall biosynthesis
MPRADDLTRESPRAGEVEDAPTVSVIIPAYNVARYIGEALDSVFAQTFEDFEVIVVNDGSPDTDELERALAPYRERIRYIEQENRGAAHARNTALRAARGRFVAFLDADDLWLPNYLTEQLNFIEGGDGYDFVYADAMQFGSPPYAGKTFMETAPSAGEVNSESLIAQTCNVITSGTLARRQSVVEAGLFDETLRRAHDFDLWLRLARGGARMAYQRKVLLRYRYHAEGLSGDGVSRVERELRVLEKVERDYELSGEERAALEGRRARLLADLKLERGKRCLAEGDFAPAAAEFRAANSFFHSWKLRVVLAWLRLAPRLLRRVYKLRTTA